MLDLLNRALECSKLIPLGNTKLQNLINEATSEAFPKQKKGSQSNSNFNSLKGALIYKYIDSFAYLMDQQSIDLAERQHEHYQEEQVKARHYVVPDNKNKLKACQKCRLLKTEDQWKKSNKCENCRDFKEEQGHNKYTTPKFESMVAILNPNRSWLRRKLFLGKNTVSGAYAVHLT